MKKILSLLAVIFALSIPIHAADLSSATCPGTGCTDITVTGQGSVAIQITGTWSGTLTFRSSVNNTTFTDLSCVSTADTDRASVTSTTGNGIYQCTVVGFSLVRVIFTSYSSGTAVVVNRTTNQAAKFSGAGGSGSGITQLTGDVTAGPGSGSQAATIANDSVTLAKIQNATANSKLLGSGSAGSGANYSELTVGSGLTMTGTTLSASGSSGGLTQIATVTTSGSGVMSFTSIPGSYTNLLIVGIGRSDTIGAGVVDVQVTFNTDTSTNYNYQVLYASNITVAGGQALSSAFMGLAEAPKAGNLAGYPTAFTMTIPYYAATTFNKVAYSDYMLVNNATAGSLQRAFLGGIWANTAAITQIDLTLGSGNWVAGSQAVLYGMQ